MHASNKKPQEGEKILELNENETFSLKKLLNLWHAVKVVLRGEFIALNAYINKE